MIIIEISDIISLLAFLLGIYSAVLSTLLVLEDNLNLKLEYLNNNYLTLSNNELINNHGKYINGYNRNAYTLAIYVRITNKSKSPTTISEFVLNNKFKLNSSSNNQDFFIPTSFEDYGTILISHSTISLLNETLKPLIELKPLSTIEGYLVFTKLEDVPKKFTIRINTVQKCKSFHLRFNITNDHRNVIV